MPEGPEGLDKRRETRRARGSTREVSVLASDSSRGALKMRSCSKEAGDGDGGGVNTTKCGSGFRPAERDGKVEEGRVAVGK